MWMRQVIGCGLALALVAAPDFGPRVDAQAGRPDQGRTIDAARGQVLPHRGRAAAFNVRLRDRLDHLLPVLMRETGLDMWVVINREYNEGPVFFSLVPQPTFAARRTTILVFYDRGPEKGVERLTVSRYKMEGYYDSAWAGGPFADQWERLAGIIAERNPKRIGVNVSRDWAWADGLSASLRDRLLEALAAPLRERVVSAEALVVRWLETRSALDLEVYPHIVALARGVVAEAFSDRVITPGVTTTEDVAWYIRQRFEDLDLPVWFMPSVDLQRPGTTCDENVPFCEDSGVIHRGDVLHTDVGITYLGLSTDTQEMAYVLKAGESDVPAGLKAAFARGNRWQDLLTAEFRTGRTGNEILAASDAAARREGLLHNTYTHPIGFHGHGAGPAIGYWDVDGPIPIWGDWKIHPNTGWSIEGNVKVPVPEWNGQLVNIKLEQTSFFDGTRIVYTAGRQTDWHVVR